MPAVEPLEARAMLAFTINLVGTTLEVTQDTSPDTLVGVVFSTQTFPGPSGDPVQVSAVRITGNTAGGSPISTGTPLALNNPVSGLPQITSIRMGMQQSGTEVRVTDQLAGITTVEGGATWGVAYAIGGGASAGSTASGDVVIVNPSKVSVSTGSAVQVDGNFLANDGWLRVASTAAVIGKVQSVQGNDLAIVTSATVNGITLQGGISGTQKVVLDTKSLLDVSSNVSAPDVTLNVLAGVTQGVFGGTISATKFTLASGGAVSLVNAANAIGEIVSIAAAGQDIAIDTVNPVTQSGAIRATSLTLDALGPVTLPLTTNKLDRVAIRAVGDVAYANSSPLQIAGRDFGITALGGDVTITTLNNLTQDPASGIQADKLTVVLPSGAGGGRSITLDSTANQVSTFVVNTTSSGGNISFSNAKNQPLTVGDGSTIRANGEITILSRGNASMTLASPIEAVSLRIESAATLGQVATAVIKADQLAVKSVGGTNLETAHNRAGSLTVLNQGVGGVLYKGDGLGLTVDVGGITTGAGNVSLNTFASGGTVGGVLQLNGGISTGSGVITLASQGGVSQVGTAAILANGLKVTNTGGGSVTLLAPANDVGTLEISNVGGAAAVSYADVNDLALAPGAGITANGKISLSVGGSFTSNGGSPIATTVGEVSITTLGGVVTLEGGVGAAAGVAVNAGTKTAAGIVVNSAIDGKTGGVSLVATDTLSSNAAGTILGTLGVSIAAPAGVSLGAQVKSTAAGVTIASTKGPLTTTAAATLVTKGGAVTVNTLGAATFDGTVTAAGAIGVTAGDAATASTIAINAAFNAVGAVQLSASNALVTKAGVTGAEVTAASGGNTTLGGPVTANAGAVTFKAGGSFSTNAFSNIVATGTVAATSVGGISLSGGATGSEVTLQAGTPDSAASVAIKAAVLAKAGDATIVATGGNLTTSAAGTVTAQGGTATLAGTAGVTVQTALVGDNVAIASADGAISLAGGSGISAGGVGLSAANGITQSGNSGGIQAAALVATNTANGGITLASLANAVSGFRATNSAPGGQVKLVNTIGLTVTTPGISTTNGDVDIVNGGFITLGGGINAGTADVSLQAAGSITQASTAAIVADDLFLGSSGGDILLDTASSNDVNFLWGNNTFLGGKFFFVDANKLEIAAPITRPITTNDGDVSITAGRLGLGPLTVGGTVNAGTADISLTANGGITGLTVHALQTTKGIVTLDNNGSGDIVLLNPGNSYPNLSAVSPNGTTINLKNSSGLGTNIVGSGLITLGGVVKIDSIGSITQTSIVETKNATFLATGNVTLGLTNNDIDNLEVNAPGNITFYDRDDLSVGVGGQGVVSTSGAADIDLAALGGNLTLNAKVSTSNSAPSEFVLPTTKTTFLAGGSIIQTAANVISGDLDMTAAGGSISLPQGANDIANLRALAAADIDYVDANDFEVGFDSVVPVFPKPLGVIAGGDLSLIAGPTLTPLVPTPLLRVTEGLAWAGDLTLEAGLNSRVGFVEFAVTNPGDSLLFAGVLRNMIEYANANTGTQVIRGATRVQPMRVVFDEFLDSPLYTVLDVQPTAPLPAITNPLDFNGTLSAAGRTGVNGSTILITATVNGLVYNPGSNDSRFEGMAVYGFATGSGLQLRSAANFVENNYFGVQRDGLTLSSNKIGIEMLGQTSTTNLIGSLIVNEAAANVIGGNTVAGVLLRNGASGNAVMGNFIGTDAGLLNDLGNLGDGIIINDANGNLVGNRNAVRPDGSAAASNAIAYNNGTGIRVTNSRAANENLGNLIENNLVDANGVDGIGVLRSRFQVIGGGTLQQANVVTSQVTGNGVNVTGSFDTRITGNFIGVDDVGTVGLGNAAAGVLVSASQRTVINQGNAIGGNQTGVFVSAGSTLTRIESNFVGTDALGSPVGNLLDGVRIDRSLENFVQLGNVVANNGRHGVSITDSTAATIDRGNIVSANMITANGFASLGAGINVEGGARHTIGGSGGGNVIMANANEGIRVVRSSRTGGTTGLRIQGNKVGTDANQEIDPTLGNTVGIRLVESVDSLVDQTNVIANNSREGVRLEATTRATIGSATVDQANAVTANGGAGILITDKISTAGDARGRNIGTSVFGNLVAENLGPGVVVEGGTFPSGAPRTTGVVVGTQTGSSQAGAGRGNTIIDNGEPGAGAPGILIDGAQGVSFSGNTIYRTDGLFDPPPAVEFRNGANAGAVAPRLQSAVLLQPSLASSQLRVSGTFAQSPLGQTAGSPVSVTVQNGVATFSTSQTGLVEAGSVVVISGTGYRVASVAADGRTASLEGITTLFTAGTGRVSASSGRATFSVSQTGVLAVGSSIVVAGRSYQLTSLSANGLSGTLSGAPTFATSTFQVPGSAGFSVVPASVLGQQYVVSVYLNEYWDGNPSTGRGYGMRLFVGTISVTVGSTGTGTFSGTVSLPAGVSALGQFVTVTATPARPIDGTTVPATSEVSSPVQAVLNAP